MNGSVMRKFGAGAVIFVIYVCLYLLTILPRGGFITLFGITGFSLSQLLGATVLLQRHCCCRRLPDTSTGSGTFLL